MSERTPAHKGGYQQPPHEQYSQLELQRLAKKISQTALPSSPTVEYSTTAAQVRKMPLHQLLQDPARAGIYHILQGWDACTAHIQRVLQ